MRSRIAAVVALAALLLAPAVPASAAPGGAAVQATTDAGAASEAELKTRLTALLKTLPGRYTIRVRELDGEKRDVSIGGGTGRNPASTVKLFIAYGVYKRIDAGALTLKTKLSSGPTVEQCLRSMIEPSDNYCAVDLRTRVGSDRLNALIEDGGYPRTRWTGSQWTTTASDTARLLARLANGTLLSEGSTKRFTKLLETQVWREAIPPGLPAGVRQASKPGTKWLTSGIVQSDAAIVWGPKSRYVLAVYGSHGAKISAITAISRTVYRHLQGKGGTDFVYSRQQMKTTDALRLREVPDGRVLLVAPKGTKVEVIDSRRLWYQVRVNGRLGWMHNSYLTLR